MPPPNSGDDMSDDDDSAEETTATGQAYVYFTGNAGPVGLMLGSEDNAPAGMWGILIVGEPNKTVSVSMTFTGWWTPTLARPTAISRARRMG